MRVLLLDSKVDLQVLERIKEHAKELGTRSDGEVEREVALTLYFAAIAAALLSHGTKISAHSWKHLERSFKTLGNQPWVPADLLQLFTRAAAHVDKDR